MGDLSRCGRVREPVQLVLDLTGADYSSSADEEVPRQPEVGGVLDLEPGPRSGLAAGTQGLGVRIASLDDAELVAQREERTVVREGACNGLGDASRRGRLAESVRGAASVALRKGRPVGLGEPGCDALARSLQSGSPG